VTDAQTRALHELNIELLGQGLSAHAVPIHYGPDAPLLVTIQVDGQLTALYRLIMPNGRLI
jgi:hypothetical protein